MAGWQESMWRDAQNKADNAKGTPQYAALQREADAKKVAVNDALRREKQREI